MLSIAVFSAPEAISKEKNHLESGKMEAVESLGLKFRQMKDSSSVPLMAPSSREFTNNRSNDRIVAFDPKELWIQDVISVQWKNPAGTLVIARMTLPPPAEVKLIYDKDEMKFCLREDFDTWKKGAASQSDDAAKIAFLSYLAGKEFGAPAEASKGGSKTPAIKKYSSSGSGDQVWAYEVIPNGAEGGIPLFFVFTFSPGTDMDRNEKAIAKFLPSISIAAPSLKQDGKKKTDEGKTAEDPSPQKELSPELAASRDAVIRNIADLKGWWHKTIDNFIIISNVEDRRTVRELEPALENSRKIFTDAYPLDGPLKAFGVCRVFNSMEDYKTYIGQEAGYFQWSGGLWDPSRKELLISPQGWGSRKDKRESISTVIFHEGAHQYLHYAVDDAPTSAWFNEGNAGYFEGIEFKSKGKYEIGACLRYLGKIYEMAGGNSIPVVRLLSMDRKEFYGDARDVNYATSYAIVYYLRKGCQVMKKKAEYENVLSRYYDAIRVYKDPEKATKFAFEGIDLDAFARDVTDFYKEGPPCVKKSEKPDPIPYQPSELFKDRKSKAGGDPEPPATK